MANILITDDNDVIRNNISKLLIKEGHNVFIASNGTECLEKLHKEKIDLLLLDLVMPGKGGVDILVEIRNIKNLKKIIITGNIQQENENYESVFKMYGVNSILFKPFRAADLINTVNKELNNTANS